MSKWYRLLGAFLVAVLVLAGCGDDDSADEPAADEPAADEPEFDAEAEAAAAEANVVAFFDGLANVGNVEGAELDTLLDETVALLEGGNEETKAQLQGLGALAAGLTIEIRDVVASDDGTAAYKFDLLIDGNPTQVTDANGGAILTDGVWQVSSATWAALAALVPDE